MLGKGLVLVDAVIGLEVATSNAITEIP